GRPIHEPAGMPVEILGMAAVRKRRATTSRGRPTIYYDYTNRTGPACDRIASARFAAPVASRLDRAELDSNVVSPGFFAAMGFSLLSGRILTEDPTAGVCRVAVVNREAADLYFGG